MSSLGALPRFLNRNLDLQRTGGSIFFRDDKTLILTDKYTFTTDHIKLIEAHFPHVSMDIISSEGSRSGFLVLFTCQSPYDRAWHRCILRLSLHFACFLCILLWTGSWTPPLANHSAAFSTKTFSANHTATTGGTELR